MGRKVGKTRRRLGWTYGCVITGQDGSLDDHPGITDTFVATVVCSLSNKLKSKSVEQSNEIDIRSVCVDDNEIVVVYCSNAVILQGCSDVFSSPSTFERVCVVYVRSFGRFVQAKAIVLK